ncbi:phage terminase large subunit [Roseateles sp.]|uniref:phage terminase large subunit n=1 Tax=Roseateles sp. TaxID=1971397 RepID=UPI0031E48C70
MLRLNDEDWLGIEREFCRRKLGNFIRRAWPVLEPGQPYIHGWHMDAISEHLEAITTGQIKRLLINIPPGTMKSMATAVFWPAWEWGPRGMAAMRFIGASHEEKLAIRDNVKMRRLIQSDWFQALWPTAMAGDQNAKTYFENDKTGWRQACPVKSMTGRRGDRVLWDDPHSVEDAHSDAALEEANRIFRETLPTRLNSPKDSAILIVMQRLSVKDVSGVITSEDMGYEHLCLPMEYEGPRKITSIGFVDPRKEQGELLFPERFPREVVERDKKIMGPYAVAGQFQQRPSPAEGGEFLPDMIQVVDVLPAGFIRWARGWDLAATEGAGDYTASAKIGILQDGRIIVADVNRRQYGTAKRDQFIRNTAAADGAGRVKQSLPQDPGQAGKSQALAMTSMLVGHHVETTLESGDKVVRARPFASQVNGGNVLMLRGPWNNDFIEELRLFPNGLNDDQVDASSRGFNALLHAPAGIFT